MSQKLIKLAMAAGLAFLGAGIFAYVVLMVNDPDKVPMSTLCLWAGVGLCPLLVGWDAGWRPMPGSES